MGKPLTGKERRFLCERCGGTGTQEAGLWDSRTKRYDSKTGTCDLCKGTGRLGIIPEAIYAEG